jgi:hypothetical protein
MHDDQASKGVNVPRPPITLGIWTDINPTSPTDREGFFNGERTSDIEICTILWMRETDVGRADIQVVFDMYVLQTDYRGVMVGYD